MGKFLAGLVVVLFVLVGGVLVFGPRIGADMLNKVEQHEPYAVSERARQLHATLLIGDWHADSTLWKRDLSEYDTIGHVDIPRMQAGNVALQMFTTVTKSPRGLNYDRNEGEAPDDITMLAYLQLWPSETHDSLTERALYQASKLHALSRSDNSFNLILTKTELTAFINKRQQHPEQVAGLIGTEGSHALDGKLENVQRLFDNGFRMMSLQHFFDNKLGGSLHGVSQAGLTEFGRQAVEKMLELDVIIDVSHSSEQVVRDVLAISDQPLVVSHTGFKGHCDSARNISDTLMQDIAARGGLIGVGYWEGAICGTHPKQVAAAIKYGITLVGEDHVALGSDYDGSVTTAFDTSEMAALTQALLDADLNETQIAKVMGGNMLRFLQQNLPD